MVVIYTVGGVGGAEEGSLLRSGLVTGTNCHKQTIIPLTTTTTVDAALGSSADDEQRPFVLEPRLVGVCAGEGHNSVVWGSYFENKAYVCGPNSAKQLGVGKQANCGQRWTPIPTKRPVFMVSAGSHHSLLCTLYGEVYSCGRGDGGQLGCGDKVKTSNFFQGVPGLEKGARHVSVASSARRFENQSASYVLMEDGLVYAFGNNNYRKLGIGDADPPARAWTPTRVLSENRFSSMHAGKHHVLAIDADGRVYAWGAGDMGRLGLEDKKHRGVPTLVTLLSSEAPGVAFDKVIARETFSLAFSSKANCAYSWGFGTRGQLGRGKDGTRCDAASPGQVVWCHDTNTVEDVVANDDAAIAFRKNTHEHLCWGKLTLGDLAVGDVEPKLQLQLNEQAQLIAFDLCGTHALIATDTDTTDAVQDNDVSAEIIIDAAVVVAEPPAAADTHKNDQLEEEAPPQQPQAKKPRLEKNEDNHLTSAPALLVVPPPQLQLPPDATTTTTL